MLVQPPLQWLLHHPRSNHLSFPTRSQTQYPAPVPLVHLQVLLMDKRMLTAEVEMLLDYVTLVVPIFVLAVVCVVLGLVQCAY